MTRQPIKKSNPYRVNSLAKGLEVLGVFASERRPLRLSDLVSLLGINHTSATRMCVTLCEAGFLRKDNKKYYHLTPKVLTLGYAAIECLRWREVAELRLKQLYDHLQETINLAILQGPEILYLIRLRKEKYLPSDLQVGSTLPVYCTGMGKALMAFSPREITDRVWPRLEFKPMGPRTINNLEAFQEALERTRQLGYAVNDEELTTGVRTLAIPVMGQDNHALMAINVTVPTKRYSLEEMLDQMMPPLRETATELSQIFKDMNLKLSELVQI